MKIVTEYDNLNEKRKYFNQIIINTEEEFDVFYNSIRPGNHIWRGSNEAKFKILTSLQLHWIKNNKPNEITEVVNFLKEIFQYFKEWNNSTLINYLENIGMEKVPYTIFSILRHYNIPTPIIDWTEDVNVALYFMTNEYCIPENGNHIDQYFTLYFISEDHQINVFKPKEVIEGFVTKNVEELKKQNKYEENFERNLSNALLVSEELCFEEIYKNDFPIFKIQDKPGDNIKYFIRNNFNISNQKGLFIHNSEPNKSLEENWYEKYMNLPLEKFSVNEKYEFFYKNHIENFFSIEINKTLVYFIQEKLKKAGITKNYIYPDLNKMKGDFETKFGSI